MTGDTSGGHQYYVCSGYLHRGKEFCGRNSVRQDQLSDGVIDAIEQEYMNPQGR
jgi:hypothetical protein